MIRLQENWICQECRPDPDVFFTDWSKRDDIKAELKVDLIILLAENGYPPVDRDEVYKEIFEHYMLGFIWTQIIGLILLSISGVVEKTAK